MYSAQITVVTKIQARSAAPYLTTYKVRVCGYTPPTKDKQHELHKTTLPYRDTNKV